MGELHDAVWHAAAREEAVTKASAELGALGCVSALVDPKRNPRVGDVFAGVVRCVSGSGSGHYPPPPPPPLPPVL